MDLEFPASVKAMTERAESVVARHCGAEQESERDHSALFPRELLADMARSGLFTPFTETAPADFMLTAVRTAEVLARGSAVAATLYFVNGLCGRMLAQHAAGPALEAVKALAAGRSSFAFAFTEPGAGTDAGSLAMSAIVRDKTYVINGEKLYATGAQCADYLLTVARTRPDGPAKAGTSLILVPRKTPGLTIEDLEKVARSHLHRRRDLSRRL